MIYESNLDIFLTEGNLSCISHQPIKGAGHSNLPNPDFKRQFWEKQRKWLED